MKKLLVIFPFLLFLGADAWSDNSSFYGTYLMSGDSAITGSNNWGNSTCWYENMYVNKIQIGGDFSKIGTSNYIYLPNELDYCTPKEFFDVANYEQYEIWIEELGLDHFALTLNTTLVNGDSWDVSIVFKNNFSEILAAAVTILQSGCNSIAYASGVDNSKNSPLIIWYADFDLDGYGSPINTLDATIQPYGYVSDNTDCDDTDATIYPGAPEIAGDKIDQDCDGIDPTPSGCNTNNTDFKIDFYVVSGIENTKNEQILEVAIEENLNFICGVNDLTGSMIVPSNFTFTFDFGDGSTSAIQKVSTTHKYSFPGTYTVKCTVTDPYGNCATSSEETIYVPKEDIIFDTGFRPSKNGYSFENDGELPYIDEDGKIVVTNEGFCSGMSFLAGYVYALNKYDIIQNIDALSNIFKDGSISKSDIKFLSFMQIFNTSSASLFELLFPGPSDDEYQLEKALSQMESHKVPIVLNFEYNDVQDKSVPGHSVLLYNVTELTNVNGDMIRRFHIYDPNCIEDDIYFDFNLTTKEIKDGSVCGTSTLVSPTKLKRIIASDFSAYLIMYNYLDIELMLGIK